MEKKGENVPFRTVFQRCFIKIKLILLILIIGIPGGNAKAWSQVERFSLNVENVSMVTFLEMLQKKTLVILTYNNEDLNVFQVSGKFDQKGVTEILDEVFTNLPFKYEVLDEHIVISKEMRQSPQEIQPKLRKISGKVYDELGGVLIGATVQIIGSTRGVVTDVDGTFTLEVMPDSKLKISFIGYQTQTIATNGTVFKITLQPQIDDLGEVTIVAFGKQKKESVVGSITTIRPAELKVPSSNLTTALAGRIAGVISYQTSGEPGQDNAQFYIRGISSFGTKAKIDPLILIDNIEMSANDLARLQTDDIATFSIMKDASAAALYGARGANGVILVTTKEGREGKTKVAIRFETSLSSPTKEVKLADPITYMKLHNEAIKTRNPLGVMPYSDTKIANTLSGRNPMVYPAVDWFDMLFKDFTVNERLNLSVSGGGKIARYYLSGTMNQDNGILKVNGKNNFNNNIKLKKYVLRSNININLSKTTEAIVRFHGTFDDYVGPLDGGTDLYNKAIHANPVLFPAVYQPDEANLLAKNILFGNAGTGNYLNPYADMVKGYKDYSTSMLLAQIELKQDLNLITQGLSARLLGNTTRYSFFDVKRYYIPYLYSIDQYDKLTDKYTLKALNTGSEGLKYDQGINQINSSFYMEAAVDYNRTFDEKHTVTGLMVMTMRNLLNANAGSLQKSLPYRNMGLAGRFTYAYSNRYFGEVNFGYNGSERFSSKERWGFFPSVGAGWMISNESFYGEGLKRILPKLKLRATYGLVGNDAIGDAEDRFFYLSEVVMNDANKGISFGTELNNPINGVSIKRYENPLITWETSYKANYGVEFNLFGKLDIQADIFTERRNNILMDRASIPSTMGLQTGVRANVGKAKSRGGEIALDYNHYFEKDLWITGRTNFTYARSKFVRYEEPNYSDMPWLSKVGRSLGQQEGFVAERLFVDEFEVYNSPTQIFDEEKVLAGDIKYKDINGDGKVTNLDKVAIGFPTTPEIIYGFGFSAGYKGFDLSVFFQGSARSSFWINPEKTAPFIDGQTALLQAYADSHWSEDNRNIHALWPRLSGQKITNNTQASTWFMRDGSFLRLKSAEVGYTLPQEITKRARVQMLRIYLSGTNLLTFSKFKLWDVEMGGNGLGYPVQMVLNAGIQLNF